MVVRSISRLPRCPHWYCRRKNYYSPLDSSLIRTPNITIATTSQLIWTSQHFLANLSKFSVIFFRILLFLTQLLCNLILHFSLRPVICETTSLSTTSMTELSHFSIMSPFHNDRDDPSGSMVTLLILYPQFMAVKQN